MIKITDRFYINADSNCYKVQEKSKIRDENSKNYGKEIFKDVGYYTTIEQCINAILKVMSREYISKNIENTINDLKEEIKKQSELIKEKLGNIKQL